jgi:thioredoxin
MDAQRLDSGEPRGSGPVDDESELARIRAQLRNEILSRRSIPSTEGSPAGAPAAGAPAPIVTDLSQGTLPAFLARHERVVLDFWAPWCGPCRAYSPILESLARELGGQVAFGKVNSDDEPELSVQWDVQSIPTTLFIWHGSLVDRLVGAHPAPTVLGRIRRSLRLASN